ncbi:hypothetical protein HPB52_016610 [Rhipicephalus sanguineus]|uniref:Uncharacterized protein n=1 Tax=Rhipicephalus sanguineus TaxID=34632 RepID=A0A9D4Q120_RHISA|nr:hypothetical protein HPB52_016610 [Rhipicephalus sanguineus]
MYRSVSAAQFLRTGALTHACGASECVAPNVSDEDRLQAQPDENVDPYKDGARGGRTATPSTEKRSLLAESAGLFVSLGALAVAMVFVTVVIWLHSYIDIGVDSQVFLARDESANGSLSLEVAGPQQQRPAVLSARVPGPSGSIEDEFTRYKLYQRDSYLTGARSFCLLNEASLGRSRRDVTYDLHLFPYHLCTDAAYCCASLGESGLQQPGAWQFRAFFLVKKRNPYAKLWLFVEYRGVQFIQKLMDAGPAVHENLASRVVDLLRTNGYEAVAFPWKPQAEVDPDDQNLFLRILKRALSEAGLELAVLVDATEIRVGVPHFLRLLEALDDSVVIVRPPPLGSGKRDVRPFSETFLLYDQGVVDSLVDLESKVREHGVSRKIPTAWHVCFLVSLAGTALILADANNGSLGASAVGPWSGGSAANGWVSVDDVCRRSWTTTRAVPYAMVAQSGIFWTATHSLETLGALLATLTNGTRGARHCMGVADPEWDDVGGICSYTGAAKFPLTTAVFDAATAGVRRRDH